MWITNDNEATQRLFSDTLVDEEGEPLLEEPVEFNDTGSAQVSAEVGEALCAHYDSIHPKED